MCLFCFLLLFVFLITLLRMASWIWFIRAARDHALTLRTQVRITFLVPGREYQTWSFPHLTVDFYPSAMDRLQSCFQIALLSHSVPWPWCLKSFSFIYECFAFIYVCVLYVSGACGRQTRSWMPWNQNWRWLWNIKRVLGNKFGSFERTASAMNGWTITLMLLWLCFNGFLRM